MLVSWYAFMLCSCLFVFLTTILILYSFRRPRDALSKCVRYWTLSRIHEIHSDIVISTGVSKCAKFLLDVSTSVIFKAF